MNQDFAYFAFLIIYVGPLWPFGLEGTFPLSLSAPFARSKKSLDWG